MPEKKTDHNPVTYFTHIPKTGGTSFTVLLDRFFPADHIFMHKVWHKVKETDSIRQYPYRLFRGHFGGGGVKLLTDQPIQFLTFLRKPELLVHSTYQFAKRRVKILKHELVAEQNMSFLGFLEHPETQMLIKNRMTRHLSFDFNEDPSTQGVFLSADTIQRVEKIIDTDQPTINDDERLVRAQRFIENSRWFGLLERFDDSLQLLCYQMKWPPVGQTQALNVHKKSKNNTIGEKESTLIANSNTCDYQLYQTSERLFNQRYQAMLDDLEQYRSSQFDGLETLLDCHYQAHYAGLKSDGLSYGFDQVLLGSGWHQREPIPNQADCFRWTGPDCVSSIDFWLQRKTYQLQIHTHNAINNAVLDVLKLTINEQPITWTTEDRRRERIYQATVPENLIKDNGLVRLGITVPEVMTHQQTFASKDERLVGIAVRRIQFHL